MSLCWPDHCYSGYRTSVAEPDMNFRYTYRWPSACSTVSKCESICVPARQTVCYPQTVVVPKCEPIRKSPSLANCYSFIERPNIHVIINLKEI